MTDIQISLFARQDVSYKLFHCKLVPTLSPDTVIGVRVPQLRKYGKTLLNEHNTESFLSELPHLYYEENNLHAFIIGEITNFDECIYHLEHFLPYIDNWATCDMLRPKSFRYNTEQLLPYIRKWLSSSHTYTVRFAIEMLMTFFLDTDFDSSYLDLVADLQSDEYYVNMMIAWYFATALAKQWNSTIGYIVQRTLPNWVHNKTIQKAIESRRITSEQKDYLRNLKII